jgi:hypothetical protein
MFAGAMVAQPPEVKPGPEHAMLKELAGAWKGKFKMQGMESDCSCTYRMVLGDLWLSSNFQTKLGEQQFRGQGMDTYDAASKKFKGVWFDSMSTKPMLMEGTYDAATKTLTMTGMGMGPDGKEVMHKIVSTMPDKDTMKERMSMAGPSGDVEMFTIEYKRDPNPPGRGRNRGKGNDKAAPKPNP